MKYLFNYIYRKKVGATIVGLLLILCGSAFIQNQPGDTIVGTWISHPDGNSKWVFSSDSTVKIYYKGNLKKSYTYKLSKTPLHCGVDMSERLQQYPDESILILTNSESSKKRCYLVYGFDEVNLGISLFGSPNLLHFKRQQ